MGLSQILSRHMLPMTSTCLEITNTEIAATNARILSSIHAAIQTKRNALLGTLHLVIAIGKWLAVPGCIFALKLSALEACVADDS